MKLLIANKNLIIRWAIISIIVLIIIFGFRSYVKSIYQKELDKNNSQLTQIENDFRSTIEKSPKSAYELTVLGKKMLDNNQNYWATVVLEAACKKDPKYRDAALLTGYAYLKLSEETRNPKSDSRPELESREILNNIQIHPSSILGVKNPNDKNKTIEQFNNLAIDFLLKAQNIDPIYPQTQQLLSIVYKNLGDEKNATICYNKYVAFNTEEH